METKLSKVDIDKLGNRIRHQKLIVDDTTLLELQSYRTSHKESLSHIFNILCNVSKRIHTSSIVTFRIKRFESIISKLGRYPEMRFSRMWDIAGCRCIVRNNEDVYALMRLVEAEKNIELVKTKDYILNPQTDGYKSLHIFLRHTCSDVTVEVQLRSIDDHNWATLVEITDLLFDSKLKEYGENKDLLEFHKLLSTPKNLTIRDKHKIAWIIKKYNYFEKLSEVFSRNYIKVRTQWFDLESQPSYKFFLIETKKDDVPKIEAFKNFLDAETKYFNVYKSAQNANIVLTHLQTPNYNQISIAYSNYILTFHSFLFECLPILESLVVESLEKRKYLSFFKSFNIYNNLLFSHITNMNSEIREIEKVKPQIRSNKKPKNKKEREWIDDIRNQVNRINQNATNLNILIHQFVSKNHVNKFLIRQIIRLINNYYKKKFNKLAKNKS